MWYFTDDTLHLSQEYSYMDIEERQSRTDVSGSYRRQADARIADEAAAHVRKERPEWRAHCLLVAPWKELEPVEHGPIQSRRSRRYVFVYEYIEAERVQAVYRLAPLMTKTGETYTSVTLTARPVRGVADVRPLMGALHEGTLYIMELSA